FNFKTHVAEAPSWLFTAPAQTVFEHPAESSRPLKIFFSVREDCGFGVLLVYVRRIYLPRLLWK
ncbi:hypothetical protein Q4R87_17945, partial [Morganella morganii]